MPLPFSLTPFSLTPFSLTPFSLTPFSRCLNSLGTAALLAGSLLGGPASAAGAAGVPLPASLPRVAHAAVLGRVSAGETLPLTLTLPLRDPAGLEALLRRQNTPGSPDFQHFLTPAEFAAQFGPTQADYDAAAQWARSQGLTVTATHPNRLLLEVSGSAQTAEAAFGVRLQQVRLPAAGGRAARVIRMPDAAPRIPAALAGRISGVVGLDTASVRRSHLRRASLTASAGTGVGGGLTVSDIRTAYDLNSFSGTGAGQTIAIFQLATFAQSDIIAYQSANRLPHVPVNVIRVSSGPSASEDTDSSHAEATLDAEMALALVPNLSSVQVYECPNTDSGVLSGYNRIANDNTAAQVSTSWGQAELQSSGTILNSENTIFKQMAAQGQAVLSAAGDYGAYDTGNYSDGPSVDDPASQPFVTGVGGTSLSTQGAGGPYSSETTWYNSSDSAGGGGISSVWAVPSYQQPVPAISGRRTVPDVSFNSDPYSTGYSIYYNGSWNLYGGTSPAAPLWAGLTALVNSRRTALNLGRVGFLNTPIYQIAQSNQAANFHDIADHSDNGYYSAVAGYDAATGWGTPTPTLLNSLTSYGLPPATTQGATTAHIAWMNTDGRLSLWNVDSAGSYVFHYYGPFAGWSVKAVADDKAGKTRILWTSTSGQISLWNVSSDTGAYTHQDYGPFGGYTATALAVGSDTVPRILWNRTDNQVSLWTVDAQGGFTFRYFGPFPSYTATGLAVGTDNRPRILWNRTDNQASLWNVDAQGSFTFAYYGPYTSYQTAALAAGGDNQARILWNRSDGQVSLWTVDAANSFTFRYFGPYPSYTATGLAVGSDNRPRILWNRTDGLASLWNVDTQGNFTYTQYGPFPGWTAKAVAAP